MLKRTSVSLILGTTILFTPKRILIQLQYPDDPEMVRLKLQYLENSTNPEYEKLYHDYQAKKDTIQFDAK